MATTTFTATDLVAGIYAWSDLLNWSASIPSNGDTVIIPGAIPTGTDDIANLSLAGLTLESGATLAVNAALDAAALTLADATDKITVGTGGNLTLGPVTASGGTLLVTSGTITMAADDPGLTYLDTKNGHLIFAGALSATSAIHFSPGSGNPSTLAFENPGSVISAALGPGTGHFQIGDTIELPGTAVLSAAFDPTLPTGTMTIVTNAGTFAFTTVTFGTSSSSPNPYNEPPNRFTVSPGDVPGQTLVSLAFDGSSYDGFLYASGTSWSDPLNWDNGVPSGTTMDVRTSMYNTTTTPALSTDDIPSLVLHSLTVEPGFDVEVAGTSDLVVGSLDVGAGGIFGVPGTATLDAASGTGIVYARGGTITVAASVDSGMSYYANQGAAHGPTGLVILAPALSSTSTLDYNGAVSNRFGAFALENPAPVTAALIENVHDGSTLELPGTAVAGVTLGGSAISVTTDAGTFAFSNVTYNTASGGASLVNGYTSQPGDLPGLVSVVFTACFAAGTRILTASGERPVESLRPGDLVVAPRSGRLAPIAWIGHRHLDLRHHPRPEDVHPVHITPGAFGPGQPHRPLVLSPDHAVFIDDALIPIRHLLNGTTIRQVPAERVTYFHVELDRHDVLLAEGLPAESYLDTGNRAAFANAPGARTLHPSFTPPPGEAATIWHSRACALLLQGGARVERLRAALEARAAELAHPGRIATASISTTACGSTREETPITAIAG